ncbi:NAD(P)H-dependent oxidoreductase [Actinomycetospora sp. OC33-EN08]|uniref:NAD(P)H-dependent oxidoreductase n=1 Tax=Actinomycetospora aurantiaca TaxID=3129233 RepID=A0ABU8MUK3_9PSEU
MSRHTVLGLGGSPNAGGRSSTALVAFLDATGLTTTVIELGDGPDPEEVQRAIEAADGVVIATPTYRARSSGLVKALLENTQRGAAGEERAPLRGKATAILHTGNAAEHFLAVDDLRSVLAGFFAAQVLSPGLFLHGGHFGPDGDLGDEARALVAAHGRAFGEFTAAVRASPAVTALAPLL